MAGSRLGQIGGWWDEPLRWGLPLPRIGSRRVRLHLLFILFAASEVMRAAHLARELGTHSTGIATGFASDPASLVSGGSLEGTVEAAGGVSADAVVSATWWERVSGLASSVDVRLVLFSLGALLIALCLHEFGHALGRGVVRWMAWMQDDAPTPGSAAAVSGTLPPSRARLRALLPGAVDDHARRRVRRARLNTTVLWPLGNLAQAWLPRSPRGNVALLPPACGPIASALVCLILTPILLSVTGSSSIVFFPPLEPAAAFAEWSVLHPDARPEGWLVLIWWVNHLSMLLVLVNLIPLYPLDAARFVEAVVAGRRGLRRAIEVTTVMGYFVAGGLFTLAMAVDDHRLLVVAIVGGVFSWHMRRSLEAAINEIARLAGSADPEMGSGVPSGGAGGATSGPGLVRDDGKAAGGGGLAAPWNADVSSGRRVAIATSDSGDRLILSTVRARRSDKGVDAADRGSGPSGPMPRHAAADRSRFDDHDDDPDAGGGGRGGDLSDEWLVAMDPRMREPMVAVSTSAPVRRLSATAEALLEDLIDDLVATPAGAARGGSRMPWEDGLIALLSGALLGGPGSPPPGDEGAAAGGGGRQSGPQPTGGDPTSGAGYDHRNASVDAEARAAAATPVRPAADAALSSLAAAEERAKAGSDATSAATPRLSESGSPEDAADAGANAGASGGEGTGDASSSRESGSAARPGRPEGGGAASDAGSSPKDRAEPPAGGVPSGGGNLGRPRSPEERGERREGRPPVREDDEREVDRILEKISRLGMKSLSNDERAVLHRATARRQRRKPI